MCGICGIIGSEDQAAAAERVHAMMNAMVHRGPDGQGFLAASRVSVGMRRLSIIDLPGGQQPIWNEDRTRCAAYNPIFPQASGCRQHPKCHASVSGSLV